MQRLTRLLMVVSLVSFGTISSLATEPWGPAALDGPSAGVVGKAMAELPPEVNIVGTAAGLRKGIFLGEVVEGGFIHAAGGKKYDVILALNGWRVDSIPELYVASQKLKPGNVATALIL